MDRKKAWREKQKAKKAAERERLRSLSAARARSTPEPAATPARVPAPEPAIGPARAALPPQPPSASTPLAYKPHAKRQRLEDEQDVPRAAKQAWARERARAAKAINAGGDEGHLARRAWRAWQAELKAATRRQFWGVPNAG